MKNTIFNFYFQNKYFLKDFYNFSKIFLLYDNIKEIILFLKTLKFELIEVNDNLKVQFNVFLPNGQSQLIDLKLIKVFIDSDNNSLLKENKALKNEILLLKDNISKNTNEISFLKNNIINLGKEMFLLKNENKKLWDEINNLKELNKNNSQSSVHTFDSKILKSINEIDFILNYIRNNDKSFFFNHLELLYRSTRDGDTTKKGRELCDNRTNVLIIIKSDSGYIFGEYSKIGFKYSSNGHQYSIDNNSFLFSYNLKKIYPAITKKKVICYLSNSGFNFYASLIIYDNPLK